MLDVSANVGSARQTLYLMYDLAENRFLRFRRLLVGEMSVGRNAQFMSDAK